MDWMKLGVIWGCSLAAVGIIGEMATGILLWITNLEMFAKNDISNQSGQASFEQRFLSKVSFGLGIEIMVMLGLAIGMMVAMTIIGRS